MGYTHGLKTEENMRDNMLTTKNKDLEFILGQMKGNILVIGLKENSKINKLHLKTWRRKIYSFGR